MSTTQTIHQRSRYTSSQGAQDPTFGMSGLSINTSGTATPTHGGSYFPPLSPRQLSGMTNSANWNGQQSVSPTSPTSPKSSSALLERSYRHMMEPTSPTEETDEEANCAFNQLRTKSMVRRQSLLRTMSFPDQEKEVSHSNNGDDEAEAKTADQSRDDPKSERTVENHDHRR
ncbi:hypothetical protein M231_01882 [Tremella mesenterica]|uniref:Uncharacterized protein n=1 Tax=Tremella mesenterica TaxID=5217 RepID=A0A4Q1BS49_TREME|nr:hypothetical protein M231_01882 [Tremella mesenterica]